MLIVACDSHFGAAGFLLKGQAEKCTKMQKAGRSGERDAKKVGNSLEKVGDFRQKVERFCSKTPYFLGEIEERERGGLRFHERFVEKCAVGCCLVEGALQGGAGGRVAVKSYWAFPGEWCELMLREARRREERRRWRRRCSAVVLCKRSWLLPRCT